MVREFADETDRVDDDGLARHVEGGLRRFGVERGEEFVRRVGRSVRQAIEKCRLAGIRVADQRDRERGVARLALRLARPLDLRQLFFQSRDAVADDAAVELELRFADATRSDAAGLALEVRPRACETRE